MEVNNSGLPVRKSCNISKSVGNTDGAVYFGHIKGKQTRLLHNFYNLGEYFEWLVNWYFLYED